MERFASSARGRTISVQTRGAWVLYFDFRREGDQCITPFGHCYMLPGVGLSFPEPDAYDTVCKWCAKSSEFKADPGSSGTNTSSSSQE